MKRMLLAMLLILLLLLSACSAPAEPLPEEAPAAPQETEPTEHTGGDAEAQEETPEPPEEEPAPSDGVYAIVLSRRENLLFTCSVYTEEAGETDVELSVTDDVRTSLGQIFDGTVVEAGEAPANTSCIFLTAGSLRILVDEYGFVSVTDGYFTGGYELSSEQFSALCALLPENSLARTQAQTYTIDLSGREDLLFSCTVWTDEEGEADVELSVTDDVRTSLGQIFDGTVVEASEMPANIPCIFLTAGSLRILVDEYGLVSVMDDSFEGCFSLPFERFSSLRALLPENATAFIHT